MTAKVSSRLFLAHRYLLGTTLCLVVAAGAWYAIAPRKQPEQNPVARPAAAHGPLIEALASERPTIPDTAPSSSDARLYIIGARRSCDCLVETCDEIARRCEMLVAEHGNRIEIRRLDVHDDADKVRKIRDASDVWVLPIVLLVVREDGIEEVLYSKDAVFDVTTLMYELRGWIESVSMPRAE